MEPDGNEATLAGNASNSHGNSAALDQSVKTLPHHASISFTPEAFRAEYNCRCRCHRLCSQETENLSDDDENNQDVEWTWDLSLKCESTEVSLSGRDVTFHKHFSNGTAAVRGTVPLQDDQHYWEIKMTTSVYGTDIMVGCGTANVDLKRFATTFVSLLGLDSESWGLSYSGTLVHNGMKRTMCKSFSQGMTIGIHLDMWLGRLSIFRNGAYVGVGFTNGIRGKTIYPMACSTAARTGMRIVRSCSFPTSLQFMCCQVLRQSVPADKDVTKAVNMAPGLKYFLINNLDWLLRPYIPQEMNETVCKLRKRGVNCVHEMIREEEKYSQRKRPRQEVQAETNTNS